MIDRPLLWFVAAVLVASAVVTIGIWSWRATTVRVTAVLLAAILFALIFFAFNELLGLPKPVEREWFRRHTERAEVIGARFDEGQAIYLWLQIPGEPAPYSYRLPWVPKLAERLSEALGEAGLGGGVVRLAHPFMHPSYEALGALNVFIDPPPILPRKSPPPPAEPFDPNTGAN